MKAVLQRVTTASVEVGGRIVSQIGGGYLILLGVRKGDNEEKARELARTCSTLRVFEDENGKFNRSIIDVKGEALVVSQFTLLADTSRGRRPSFTGAEEPARAKALYECFTKELGELGVPTRAGIFGEKMAVSIVNDGPVTIILEV
jgi:D-tyrosyl-tRNA(Tyr) deacylase